MDDFVEQVKQANRIESVIEETGTTLRARRGRYIHGREHDSLVIDCVEQAYFWNSQGESGDVITWLEKRRGWDFKTAVEWLARRAHLPEPEWGRQDNQTRLATRAREDAFTVAARVFVRRMRGSAAAVDYARGRGWTDETIQRAGLGYTGDGTAEEQRDLEGELSLHGLLPSPCPLPEREREGMGEAVRAVCGIPAGMLVYPHVRGGRVRYLSCRAIVEKRHYNLPKDLAGERQPYFNFVYGSEENSCVVVEGQADAITLGQWGIPAVALAGTAMEDWLAAQLSKHSACYVGLDADEAGEENSWKVADRLGPLTRLVRWPGSVDSRQGAVSSGQESVDSGQLAVGSEEGIGGRGQEAGATSVDSTSAGSGGGGKDANDWLRMMNEEGVGQEEQVGRVRDLLDAAAPYVVEVAKWAGGQKGAAQDEAFKRAFRLIVKIDPELQGKYRKSLVQALGIELREYTNQLKNFGKKNAQDDERVEEVEILGGFIDGYVIEYLWDEQSETASFAYRDPDGRIETAEELKINGKRYVPKTPNSMIRQKGVLFPSGLGATKPTRELVAIVEAFINRYYLLDDRFFSRMAAYYVLLTWIYDCFEALPYLRATGDYGSGKSQLMLRIGHLCYRLMITGGAASVSSLFHAFDEYRGTAFMDEMDLKDGGDMTNDIVKILNQGAMANTPVWRSSEVIRPDGTRNYDTTSYNVYGPKLLAMRKDFADKAVSSRCLTIQLSGKEAMELKLKGVRLHLNKEFYQQALAIRNLLLRWRLEKWQPEILVDEDLIDAQVSARLNQVTMPLKAVARDDPELMGDITQYVRSLNEDLIMERSMRLDARVLDVILSIRNDSKYADYLFRGVRGGIERYFCMNKHVTKLTNILLDELNAEERADIGEEKDKRKGKESISGQRISSIVKQTLQLMVHKGIGGNIEIFLDDDKLEILKVKYGLKQIS